MPSSGAKGGIGLPKWLKILLAIVAVIAGLVLLLFVAARIAGYSSTMELVYYLVDYLEFIWQERLFA